MSRPFWILLLLIPAACSQRTGRPVRQADGGYSLSCKGPLSECLRHAEQLCRDDGYTVADARDVHQLLGGETGQSRVMIRESDAIIYCGAHGGPPESRPPIALKREPEPASPALAPPPAKPVTACVAGATQACVGPAGCSGGQACASDGSHFETCDCGHAATAP